MGDHRHKRSYPEGPVYQMTPEWKAMIDPALEALGKTKTWLASQIRWTESVAGDGRPIERMGVDKSAITVLLRPASMTSRLVPEICRILEIPMPVHGVSLDQSDLMELAVGIDEDGMQLVRNLMKQLRSRLPRRSDQ